MIQNQKADKYSAARRYKVYSIYCGEWSLVGFSRDINKAERKYKMWAEEDGAYTKASEMIVKLVDTLTNETVLSQNC